MISQWQNSEKKLDERLYIFPEYVQQFLRHSMATMKPTTLLDYANDINQFLNWLITKGYSKKEDVFEIETTELESLYREDIEEYRFYLKNLDNKLGEKFKDTTLNRKFSALKSLFSYLETTEKRGTRETFIVRNPMTQIELINTTYSDDVRLKNVQSGLLVREEIKKFREFVSHDYGELVKDNNRLYNRWVSNKERDVAIISLILGSGLRVSEVVDIKLTDLDLKARKVDVYRKSGYKRTASISKTASIHIENYLSIRNAKYPGDSEFLFVTNYKGSNSHMQKRSIQKMIKKYAEVFEKPNLTAHKLRHSFATNHYAVNNNIRLLQTVLDHSNTDTTAIYTHIFDSELHESIDIADDQK